MGAGGALGSFMRGQGIRIFAFVWFSASIVGNSFLDGELGELGAGLCLHSVLKFPWCLLAFGDLKSNIFLQLVRRLFARSIIIDITSFLLVVIQTCIGEQ